MAIALPEAADATVTRAAIQPENSPPPSRRCAPLARDGCENDRGWSCCTARKDRRAGLRDAGRVQRQVLVSSPGANSSLQN
jgi:hypothetical protein